MSERLLIAIAQDARTLDHLEDEVRTKASLVTRQRRGDAVVMSSGDRNLLLPNGDGLVFGELFARADRRRVKTISAATDEAVRLSGGRTLVSDFWGDYVAVVFAADGAVQIVRSPFGATAVYRMTVSGAEVLSNDVGLLIDLGWLAPVVDWGFAAHFLAFPFHRARRTGFVGLTELPAGVRLTLSSDQERTEQVLWSPWDHVAGSGAPPDPERLRDEVRRCVRAWTEGRDGLLLELSGGLDSSILGACLWDASTQVTCANMVSPARDGDERLYARAVAERIGLPLREIELELGGLDLTALPSIRRPRPSAHALLGSWDRALSDLAVDLAVDAFVSGGGGDNVFFNTHGSSPAADALRRGAVGIWWSAVRDLARLHGCGVWRAAGMSVRRAATPLGEVWRADRRFMTPEYATARLEPHPWLDRPRGALPGKVDHIKGLMGAQNYLDAFPRSTTAPMLTPLLSQPIVELCLSIPSWRWIENGRDRAMARQAFAQDLPSIVLDRRTKGNLAGFAGPAFEAARGSLAEHLLDGRLAQEGLLDTVTLGDALTAVGPPKGADYFRILQIADVESWARRWS